MAAIERKGYGGSKLTVESSKIREANRRETERSPGSYLIQICLAFKLKLQIQRW